MMNVMLGLIIFFSLIGGVFSLAGGLILLSQKRLTHETMLTLISFAAGVLLSVSLADLLPEAVEIAETMKLEPAIIYPWVLWSMVGFFLFERSFMWFHHHHGPHGHQPDPLTTMVWVGDTLHNFLDGIVIATSFLINVPLGITTTIAVSAHEIPQEIADFSLFLSKGMSKKKVLLINIFSALATTAAAVLTYYFWTIISPWQPQLLAATAGMFIYIAGSDLIPELHDEYKRKRVFLQTFSFLIGIALIYVLRLTIG